MSIDDSGLNNSGLNNNNDSNTSNMFNLKFFEGCRRCNFKQSAHELMLYDYMIIRENYISNGKYMKHLTQSERELIESSDNQIRDKFLNVLYNLFKIKKLTYYNNGIQINNLISKSYVDSFYSFILRMWYTFVVENEDAITDIKKSKFTNLNNLDWVLCYFIHKMNMYMRGLTHDEKLKKCESKLDDILCIFQSIRNVLNNNGNNNNLNNNNMVQNTDIFVFDKHLKESIILVDNFKNIYTKIYN